VPTVVSKDVRLWSPASAPGTGILDMIFSGDTQLPQFQRDYVWNSTDRKKLLVSILEGHPIGSILSLEVRKEKPQFSWTQFNEVTVDPKRFENYEPEEGIVPPNMMILDGQQRLTTLARLFSFQEKQNWYLLLDGDTKNSKCPNSLFRKYREHLDDKSSIPKSEDWAKWIEEQIDLESIIKMGSAKDEESLPTKLKWGSSQKRLPISLISSKDNWKDSKQKFTNAKKKEDKKLGNRILKAAKDGDKDKQNEAEKAQEELSAYADFLFEFMDALTDRIAEYTIPVVSIPKDMKIAGVCKVFTNLNTKGVKLSAFDLCVATLYPSGIRLKEKWDQAKSKNKLLATLDDPKLPLQTIALIEGVTPKTARLPQEITKEMIDKNWDNAVEALETAIGYLDEHCGTGISGGTDRCLPYKPLLCPLAALVHHKPMPSGTTSKVMQDAEKYQMRLRSWHYTAACTQRYSEGTDNKQELDYKEMTSWFAKEGNWDDEHPNWMETGMNTLYGSKSGGLGKGVLSLLNAADPKDWVKQTEDVAYGKSKSSDLHHIFPKAMMIAKIMKELGCTKEQAGKKFAGSNFADGEYAGDSVANLAWLLTETNNSYINDDPPSEYIKKLTAAKPKEEVIKIMGQQGISPDAFAAMEKDDYHDFRKAREAELRQMLKAKGNLSEKVERSEDDE
tara:strand:- start:97 stop:2118 length:2022 start_codon:yes stop_codon:yes gene_type:complete